MMQTYIIRIYRRNQNNPEQIVGVVQESESISPRPFKNTVELLKLINAFSGSRTVAKS